MKAMRNFTRTGWYDKVAAKAFEERRAQTRFGGIAESEWQRERRALFQFGGALRDPVAALDALDPQPRPPPMPCAKNTKHA